jgi:hypothetical protein
VRLPAIRDPPCAPCRAAGPQRRGRARGARARQRATSRGGTPGLWRASSRRLRGAVRDSLTPFSPTGGRWRPAADRSTLRLRADPASRTSAPGPIATKAHLRRGAEPQAMIETRRASTHSPLGFVPSPSRADTPSEGPRILSDGSPARGARRASPRITACRLAATGWSRSRRGWSIWRRDRRTSGRPLPPSDAGRRVHRVAQTESARADGA